MSQETKGFYKLSWLQRIGFGAGDLAQNLIYQTICMYLLFFYTDVYVLGGDAAKSAGLAGTMFLIVRLVDVLWDPLVGTFDGWYSLDHPSHTLFLGWFCPQHHLCLHHLRRYVNALHLNQCTLWCTELLADA